MRVRVCVCVCVCVCVRARARVNTVAEPEKCTWNSSADAQHTKSAGELYVDTLFASTKALLRTLDDRAHVVTRSVAARTYSTQELRDSKYSKPSPPSAQHTPTLLPPDIGNNSTHIEAEWNVERSASATAATELTNSKRAGLISSPPAPLGTKQ
jgi:hypothetical protein